MGVPWERDVVVRVLGRQPAADCQRAEQNWSQAEVAARLGVSRQTINAIETGKYDPSLPLAFGLARLFGRRIEEVFDPDGANRDDSSSRSNPNLPV